MSRRSKPEQNQLYRVAVIGCGGRGREHAIGLRADSRCQVVGLCDIKAEAAEKLKADYGFESATLYDDYATMLREERPDVVAICLWTPLHRAAFQACIDAGIRAVLSEKPMAPTWGECQAMATLAEEHGCQLTFCHQRRFAQGNQLVRRLLAEGRIGQVERMDLYSPRHLLDCGTHTFDQALSFNGESPAKWVLGAVDATAPFSYFEVPAETMAVGTVVFENGVRATIQVGGPDMDLWGGVRVHGSDGFLQVTWDGVIERAVVFSDPTWQPEVVADPPGGAMIGVVKNAIDSLESGLEPELSYRKALRAAEIIFAFYESVRRHARVELPLTGISDNPFITMLESGVFGDVVSDDVHGKARAAAEEALKAKSILPGESASPAATGGNV